MTVVYREYLSILSYCLSYALAQQLVWMNLLKQKDQKATNTVKTQSIKLQLYARLLAPEKHT